MTDPTFSRHFGLPGESSGSGYADEVAIPAPDGATPSGKTPIPQVYFDRSNDASSETGTNATRTPGIIKQNGQTPGCPDFSTAEDDGNHIEPQNDTMRRLSEEARKAATGSYVKDPVEINPDYKNIGHKLNRDGGFVTGDNTVSGGRPSGAVPGLQKLKDYGGSLHVPENAKRVGKGAAISAAGVGSVAVKGFWDRTVVFITNGDKTADPGAGYGKRMKVSAQNYIREALRSLVVSGSSLGVALPAIDALDQSINMNDRFLVGEFLASAMVLGWALHKGGNDKLADNHTYAEPELWDRD